MILYIHVVFYEQFNYKDIFVRFILFRYKYFLICREMFYKTAAICSEGETCLLLLYKHNLLPFRFIFC